ncbi:MAG TPA: transposase [Opitutaceae bacterium]|nr:transposase [Opitutaceae bacterium]
MQELGRWASRGYLPHYEDGKRFQIVTYRLIDSLPLAVFRKLEEIRRETPSLAPGFAERHLDLGHGSCRLRDPQNAKIIVDAWKFFDRQRYLLHAWVVMPNHVHVLFELSEAWPLSKILHSWKSWSAKRIIENERGPSLPAGDARVWQREYFDRFIRNEEHYAAAVRYIHENPVKAGLVRKASDWEWSSAADLDVIRRQRRRTADI